MPTFADVDRLHTELGGYLVQHRVNPATAHPCIKLYHDPEDREQDVDLEASAAVDASLPEAGRVKIHTLPAVEMVACLVHRGSCQTIGEAYSALLQWIAANSYRIIGEDRAIYIQGPAQGAAPDDYVTEIQLPVSKS